MDALHFRRFSINACHHDRVAGEKPHGTPLLIYLDDAAGGVCRAVTAAQNPLQPFSKTYPNKTGVLLKAYPNNLLYWEV